MKKEGGNRPRSLHEEWERDHSESRKLNLGQFGALKSQSEKNKGGEEKKITQRKELSHNNNLY